MEVFSKLQEKNDFEFDKKCLRYNFSQLGFENYIKRNTVFMIDWLTDSSNCSVLNVSTYLWNRSKLLKNQGPVSSSKLVFKKNEVNYMARPSQWAGRGN